MSELEIINDCLSMAFDENKIRSLCSHIKQNGLALDSPLLWALVDKKFNYLAKDRNGRYNFFTNEAFINENLTGWVSYVEAAVAFGFDFIKINYTGDWKDSLTRRPEGL